VPMEYGAPTAGNIAHVELVYHTGKYEDVFMPYYRFYVALPVVYPGEAERLSAYGLTSYGIYDVLAVRPEYIAN